MSKVDTNFNKAISENWSIVAGFLAFIFTAGTLFAQFTELQSELKIVHERLDEKIIIIDELEDRIIKMEKDNHYRKGFSDAKGL